MCIDGHFRPPLRWRLSERERKLSNRLAASSFFQNSRCANLRSHNWFVRYLDWSLIEATVPVSHDVPGGQWNNWPWFPHDVRASNTKHIYTIWKLEQDLEQVPQPVQTNGGLAKLLAPRKWERFSVLDPRQSKRSGFHSDEGRTWLMHLCISTDPIGSTALYFGLDLSFHPIWVLSLVHQPVQTSCGLAKLLASVEHGCPSVRVSPGRFSPHFAGARAKRRSFFEPTGSV